MLRNHWPFLLIAGVVLCVGLVGALLNSPASFALGQPALAAQAADVLICPLSPTQEKDSIAAFSAMVPVFQDPRCINCHGAVDPFAADGKHLGGRIDIPELMTTVVDPRTGKLVDVAQPSNPFQNCDECHGALPGWHIPSSELFFVGKDAPTLCHQMKSEALTNSAETFLAHIEHDGDGVKFIAEAFKGTRGLDATGQAKYEDETKLDYKTEPPPLPMTREKFIELGHAWIKAMGGKYRGGDTCGCKPHAYSLQFGADIGYVFDQSIGSGKLTGKYDSHVDFKIPITFNDDGSFSGETTADRTVSGPLLVTTPAGDISCKVAYTVVKEAWKVEGTQPENGGWFDVKLSNTWPILPESKAACVGVGGAASAAFTLPVGPAGLVTFQMPDGLDGDPNGKPGPLEISPLPSIQKYTVHWVDESPP